MAGFRDVVGRVLQVGLDLLGKQKRRSGVRTVGSSERAGRIVYAPDLDGAADPGEIVWTWVPFEDQPARGKDRPVLVVAHAPGSPELLGLMLSSRERDRDDVNWVGIGSGPWDGQGRESWVRLDRVLEVPERGIRREGAVLPRDRFDRVAGRLRRDHGWS